MRMDVFSNLRDIVPYVSIYKTFRRSVNACGTFTLTISKACNYNMLWGYLHMRLDINITLLIMGGCGCLCLKYFLSSESTCKSLRQCYE